MLTDAHVHFAALEGYDPGFPERFAASGAAAVAACHDEREWAWTRALLAGGRAGARFAASLGIHPQAVTPDGRAMGLAPLVEGLAAAGELAAIGEAGFDFFGDAPNLARDAANEAAQREAFEFQLGLAERTGTPLLAHVRKATDLAFEYAPRLARLGAVVFHSWAGTPLEALSMLRRGVEAYFSFGAVLLNGHKRAIETARTVPEERLLVETDAPWQPPRGFGFCAPEHAGLVMDALAAIRGKSRSELEERVAGNFARAYPRAASLVGG
jgi:TatD DNase family protein